MYDVLEKYCTVLSYNCKSRSSGRRKVLVHVPSNEVITSYVVLERKIYSLGWERYYDDLDLLHIGEVTVRDRGTRWFRIELVILVVMAREIYSSGRFKVSDDLLIQML
uniref:Flowering-promoting factor 1-like protein 3 n=1 Tax=Nicotiana sylvestris TaxID=4096 RepID=A0A1U7UYH3_NICSY|nr:PREDICTED: flowering-promoting factor 1-like protein 3 [Nicotiana sylvestris]